MLGCKGLKLLPIVRPPYLLHVSKDKIGNSPYCQPYNSYDVSSENLVMVQLIIPKSIFFLFSSLLWLILY